MCYYRQEIAELNRKLKEKRLRAAYDTQIVNEAQRKLREMESKAKKLHAQNIKLTIQLEEAKTKREKGQSQCKVAALRVNVFGAANDTMPRCNNMTTSLIEGWIVVLAVYR